MLDFLGDHPLSDYSITEMAEKSDVSRPTVYDELPELQRLGMIKQTRTLGNSRLFQIDTDHSVVQEILSQDMTRAREEAEDLTPNLDE
ncbi:hypothetical protein BRD56_05755 [Thermoplasmatales archaeon SW_10_69_26]|nr:MAG: hypothetical protein BRD56_05755 [Thermoplasmatales archaeon SW_10_69_26]